MNAQAEIELQPKGRHAAESMADIGRNTHFHKTILKEFYLVTFRKKIYTTLQSRRMTLVELPQTGQTVGLNWSCLNSSGARYFNARCGCTRL